MFSKVILALCFAAVALARPSPQDGVTVVPVVVGSGPTVDIAGAKGVPIIAVPVPVVVSSGAAQSSGPAVVAVAQDSSAQNAASQPQTAPVADVQVSAEPIDTPATTVATEVQTEAQTQAQTEAQTEATTTTTTTTETPVPTTGLIGLTSAPVVAVGAFEGTAAAHSAWARGNTYKVGDLVTHNGETYKVQQAHVAEADNWTPAQTPALWIRVPHQ